MTQSRRPETLRLLAAGSVSLLGGGLLAVPLYDIFDDVTDLSWQLTTTLIENLVFILLSGALVAGGVWLARTDWQTTQVATVARRTLLSTVAIAALIGWAGFMQLQAMHDLKPVVLGMNGVLVGSVTSFAMSVSSVRATKYQREAQAEQQRRMRLTDLHEAANALKRATDREEACDIVADALADLLPVGSYRIVVDDEAVVEHGTVDERQAAPEIVPAGSRGRIELHDGPVDEDTLVMIELLADYFDSTLRRLDHRREIHEERDVLEFVNRTLRHDLTGDLTLVRARLRMLDRNVVFEDESYAEHLGVALERVDDMEEFVTTMRTYMQSVIGDNHTLEAKALAPVVEEQIDTIRQMHPEADVRDDGVPSAVVSADDLLERVFHNLLTNAVEHNNASPPRVVVDGERDGDLVRIRVADNGPGISADRREAVFERGERGTDSDGTGFGLYLVRDVVENYGGTACVETSDLGGTAIELTLPVAGD